MFFSKVIRGNTSSCVGQCPGFVRKSNSMIMISILKGSKWKLIVSILFYTQEKYIVWAEQSRSSSGEVDFLLTECGGKERPAGKKFKVKMKVAMLILLQCYFCCKWKFYIIYFHIICVSMHVVYMCLFGYICNPCCKYYTSYLRHLTFRPSRPYFSMLQLWQLKDYFIIHWSLGFLPKNGTRNN